MPPRTIFCAIRVLTRRSLVARIAPRNVFLPTTSLRHNTTRIPPPPPPPKPEYRMTFTCSPCGHRSSHTISKQGYHKGSVLITCPECRNRHIISDHLKIFGDKDLTIEDLMKERGQIVKKGTLSEDGNVEFWEDGTTTQSALAKARSRKSDQQDTESNDEDPAMAGR